MRTNAAASTTYRTRAGVTHEGGPASLSTPEQLLERSVASCLLFEDTFYEKGSQVAATIVAACAEVSADAIAKMAVRAREEFHLRHVPLFLLAQLDKRRAEDTGLVQATVERVIQRADELTELPAIIQKANENRPLKKVLSAQVKKGLARAFQKFDAYRLAKYNRDSAIRLRDVLFLCHAKPKNEEQAATWKALVDGTLAAPDTWEVALSAGADKKATWERLLSERKLGAMALLRNLRNMVAADVERTLVNDALKAVGERPHGILPFQFLGALKAAPSFAPGIERAMLGGLSGLPKLPGETLVVVDVSGSMHDLLSAKSTLTRLEAASALAVLLREVCDSVRVYTFSNELVEVAAFRGLALVSHISNSQQHGGTYLGAALQLLKAHAKNPDRIVVVTDEQSADPIPAPWGKGYIVNCAPYVRGVRTQRGWTRINGFSERVVDYVRWSEAQE